MKTIVLTVSDSQVSKSQRSTQLMLLCHKACIVPLLACQHSTLCFQRETHRSLYPPLLLSEQPHRPSYEATQQIRNIERLYHCSHRSRCRAEPLRSVLIHTHWKREEEQKTEEWHFARQNQTRQRSLDVVVIHVLIWLDGVIANEDADDEDLQSIEADDAFESGELEHDFMGRELLLLHLVEAETSDDCDDRGHHFDDREPYVREAWLIRSATIYADGNCNGGREPDKDGDRKILKGHVPYFL